MQQESLSYKTIKNASYGFLAYAWPIAFSVFVTPVVVNRLGIKDYGVYVITLTINGFLGLLDLGLSTSLVKFVSQYVAVQDTEKLQQLLDSANSYFVLVGVLGWAVYACIGQFFLPAFHIENISHIREVFYLAGATFAITSLSTVYTTAPQAMQRYDISARLSMLQLTLYNAGILTLVLMGYHLKMFYALSIFITLIMVFLYRVQFRRMLPQLHYRLGWNWPVFSQAFRFGLLAALNNLSTGALNLLDRLIIPLFTGPSMLSYYSLPGNVAQKTSGVVGSLTSVLFPMSSQLAATGEEEKLKMVYRRSIRATAVVAAAITTGICAFAYPILYFWLGKDFAVSGYGILLILAVTYFILALYQPLINFLMGYGKIVFLTYTSLALAVLNLLLLLALVPRWHIYGAAWAFLGGVAPVPLVFYFIEKKFLRLDRFFSWHAPLFAKIFFVAAAVYGLSRWLLVPAVRHLWQLVLLGPLSVLLYFACYYGLGFFEAEDLLLLRSFFDRAVKKFKG